MEHATLNVDEQYTQGEEPVPEASNWFAHAEAFKAEPLNTYDCSKCQESFISKNKLHRHIRAQGCVIKEVSTIVNANQAHEDQPLPIIESSAPAEPIPAFGFKNWKYVTTNVSFDLSLLSSHTVCIDTGCTISLVDRAFLTKVATVPTKEAPTVKVRGVGGLIDSKEHVMMDFYIKGSTKGKPAIAHFRRSIRVVDNLGDVNMLVGVDVLRPEEITPNIKRRVLEISSCGDFEAPIEVKPRSNISLIAQSKKQVVIPPRLTAHVPIMYRKRAVLPEGDFMFEPTQQSTMGEGGGASAAIVNANTCSIVMVNTTFKPQVVPRHSRLGTVCGYKAEGAYMASPESLSLANGPISWKKKVCALTAITTAALLNPNFHPFGRTSNLSEVGVAQHTSTILPPVGPEQTSLNATTTTEVQLSDGLEQVLQNGLTIYGTTAERRQKLAETAAQYPGL